jgi:leucyl aminopeptidase (aminopeptidase T)
MRGNPIRELADRLAEEAARAAEYRVRLELTEQAQSTLELEFAEERRLREEAERERDELAARIEAIQETRDDLETVSEGEVSTEPTSDTDEPRRSSWWRRFFGFE